MAWNPAEVVIFGAPLYILAGIMAFFALLVTAVLGLLVIRGKAGVKFSWHMALAAVTVILAIIHGILVVWLYFG